MKDCWKDNWFYIYEDNIAPLLIGEWGGYMTQPNITWMTYMRQLIKNITSAILSGVLMQIQVIPAVLYLMILLHGILKIQLC